MYFRIIKCVNTIFYRHLCNWIIYGELVDVHNEFFICDGHCPDENFLYQEQLAEGVTFNKTEAAWTFVGIIRYKIIADSLQVE